VHPTQHDKAHALTYQRTGFTAAEATTCREQSGWRVTAGSR